MNQAVLPVLSFELNGSVIVKEKDYSVFKTGGGSFGSLGAYCVTVLFCTTHHQYNQLNCANYQVVNSENRAA